ncbi:hypothetical protein KAU39_03205 [bacterium]|nr:hypothetical protein [bacterium]
MLKLIRAKNKLFIKLKVAGMVVFLIGVFVSAYVWSSVNVLVFSNAVSYPKIVNELSCFSNVCRLIFPVFFMKQVVNRSFGKKTLTDVMLASKINKGIIFQSKIKNSAIDLNLREFFFTSGNSFKIKEEGYDIYTIPWLLNLEGVTAIVGTS